jgi:hypothetical protein
MNYALTQSNSYIYSALLKHGHSNFSLTILEYCDKEKCLEREDFFLSSFPHEYNILEKAGSPLGRKHSDETPKIMSENKKGENNPMYNKPRADGAGNPSQRIEVTDIKNNTTTSYNSMSEAARALNIYSCKIIYSYFLQNQKKPYKGQYTFKKVN